MKGGARAHKMRNLTQLSVVAIALGMLLLSEIDSFIGGQKYSGVVQIKLIIY